MLTVHHLGMSQSERIVWLCEELELDYDFKRYDRRADKEATALVMAYQVIRVSVPHGLPVHTQSVIGHMATPGDHDTWMAVGRLCEDGREVLCPCEFRQYEDVDLVFAAVPQACAKGGYSRTWSASRRRRRGDSGCRENKRVAVPIQRRDTEGVHLTAVTHEAGELVGGELAAGSFPKQVVDYSCFCLNQADP